MRKLLSGGKWWWSVQNFSSFVLHVQPMMVCSSEFGGRFWGTNHLCRFQRACHIGGMDFGLSRDTQSGVRIWHSRREYLHTCISHGLLYNPVSWLLANDYTELLRFRFLSSHSQQSDPRYSIWRISQVPCYRRKRMQESLGDQREM